MGNSSIVARLKPVCRALGACCALAASLVVFPNAVPWLVAAWLLAYTLLVLFGRDGRLCLVACGAALLVKRLAPAPGLVGLIVVMAVILMLGVVYARRGRPTSSRRFAVLSVIAVWSAWVGMTADWREAAHCRHPVILHSDRPVVCLGDSMTSLGPASTGYPRDLQQLISVPVLNLGVPGIQASAAVDDCLPGLARHNPQAVVVELGAHDFLNGRSRASTKASLKTIIAAARHIGAEVVLMEIPRAYVSDPYWGLEREIARQEDVELIPDTAMRTLFLRSRAFPPGSWLGEPYLTDETGIHPTPQGNRILAQYVAEALQRMYGPRIRR